MSKISKKHLIISLVFTLFLMCFELIYLPITDFDKSYLVLSEQLFFSFTTFSLTIIFSYLAFSSPYIWRIVYLFAFCFATFVEYGYYLSLKRFSNSFDLENVIFGTNLDHKIDAIMIYFNGFASIPCIAFFIVLIILKPLYEKGLKQFLLLICISALTLLSSAIIFNNYYPTLSATAFYRTIITSPLEIDFLNFTPRTPVSYKTNTKPKLNLVLIVDESINGKHLSINGYNRPTTPVLDELNSRGLIKNWGLAVSGSTCSINSNKLLISGINELTDRRKQFFKNPTIFQYAKAMGFKTHYLDGQMTNLWSFSDFDKSQIDNYINVENLTHSNDFYTDEELASIISKILENSTSNFILVNKRGTHIPYQNSYPKSDEVWKPIYFDTPMPAFKDKKDENQAFINSYDNAVKFNLQSFFSKLFANGVAEHTIFIYTSDHGQNIREVQSGGSHCGDLPQQTIVPLMLISNKIDLPEIDTSYRASHSNIFSTLLDFMEYPEAERKLDYNISLLKAKFNDSKQRFYYSGNDMRKIDFDETLIETK